MRNTGPHLAPQLLNPILSAKHTSRMFEYTYPRLGTMRSTDSELYVRDPAKSRGKPDNSQTPTAIRAASASAYRSRLYRIPRRLHRLLMLFLTIRDLLRTLASV